MSEREAVERVIERMYKDRLRKTGRLPSSRDIREIEKKAKDAAENTDKASGRRS